MDIPEIKDLIPKLEIERNQKYGFERAYFLNKTGKRVYVSNPIIEREKKLVAWIETMTGFDDQVEVKIYQRGSINRLKARWKFFPIDGSCLICFMQFFEKELIIAWRDNHDHHLVRIEFPTEEIEVNIKMLRLGPLIHFDGKQIISYKNYGGQVSNRNIRRIKIPKLENLKPLNAEEAENTGIQLSEYWDF